MFTCRCLTSFSNLLVILGETTVTSTAAVTGSNTLPTAVQATPSLGGNETTATAGGTSAIGGETVTTAMGGGTVTTTIGDTVATAAGGGGGGGGTFVVRGRNTSLIVAGGGGGLRAVTSRHEECDANTNTSGNPGYNSWSGGSNGHGSFSMTGDDTPSGESDKIRPLPS